ncbi:TonB-dependent receptor [Luteolibacter sp. LG18]|uniref:TonB-dependent receptor n=1 Tax=Luteolibacter sp. LG18 TaxID=2819286 RepID=UPI002B2BB7C3|nr:TonB-dependent receptor [Luteolibacter sp. LG18]
MLRFRSFHALLLLAALTPALRAHDGVLGAMMEDMVVTGKAEDVLGEATTSSTGHASHEELMERPYLRRGELLETVPGMVVTQHSGSGKANQYFVRGYNLDHGTDFGVFVDGMPANLRSHAHGQGYADTNFLIPEFIGRLDYTKGPYAAENGDLTTAGTAKFSLVDSLEHGFLSLTAGEDSYFRAVFGDSLKAGSGILTLGLESSYNEGPWVLPEDAHRLNGLVKWHRREGDDEVSVTLMASDGKWRSTDQIPQRAVDMGMIDRFGYIDPTDGGDSQRYSLSADFKHRDGNVLWEGNVYAGFYHLDLFSDFTYFLNDPVNGDQFRQSDERIFGGANLKATLEGLFWFGHETRVSGGFQTHNDWILDLGLANTYRRADLSVVREDDLYSGNYSLWGEAETKWTSWFRTVAGLRADAFAFSVNSSLAANSGTEADFMVNPKLSLIFGPWDKNEFYVNAGTGFHSNDARGTTLHVDPSTGLPTAPVDPLVRTFGTELGWRAHPTKTLATSLALWTIQSDSELIYVGDAGNVEAGGATTRIGVEATAYWRPCDWISVDGELAVSQGRYDDPNLSGGPWIENQVPVVLSTGLTLGEKTGWFGALRSRWFSARPLTADKHFESSESFQVNARAGYRTECWELAVDVFNVLDRADNDIEYYYTSRLPGEPLGGVDDYHIHPAEPRSVRVTATYRW